MRPWVAVGWVCIVLDCDDNRAAQSVLAAECFATCLEPRIKRLVTRLRVPEIEALTLGRDACTIEMYFVG